MMARRGPLFILKMKGKKPGRDIRDSEVEEEWDDLKDEWGGRNNVERGCKNKALNFDGRRGV